jgi:hypothetical protein
MEEDKPTFIINHPSFLGLPVNQDEDRIERYCKTRSCPKIESLYVHGHLEFELGFDICSFVSGEIKDIEFQNTIIFDLNDVKHDAKIVLVHDEQDRIYGYIVSPEEDLEKIKDQMIKSIKRYNCI